MKLLNKHIRYIAATAKKITTEVKNLKKKAEKKKFILIKLKIIETLKMIKTWSAYNLKSDRYNFLIELIIIKKAVKSIKRMFLINFKNKNEFIDYVKNELSKAVVTMIKS